MFVLMRAATYATLFVGLLLVFLPARVLSWSGVVGPARIGVPQGVGVVVAVAGAALFYWSGPLLAYAGVFILITHAFVVLYEEPTLRRMFGEEYEGYCRRVRRWWPRLQRAESP